MILADENIDFHIIRALKASNIIVHSVSEISPGISDSEVIHLCVKLDAILLTEDKDFGEWVFSHEKEGMSVIFLRYHVKERKELIRVLLDLIQERGEELYHKYCTITVNKIRIRHLEK